MKPLKLEKYENSKKSRHALAGANIRKELKHKFPNQKFSVTTDSFSGGTSLHVKWIDGVTEAEVQAITNKYEYGSFNGMEDIYEYDKDHDGSYGEVKYLQTDRKFSKEAYEEALQHRDRLDIEIKVSSYDSSAWIDIPDRDESYRIYEYLKDKSFYKKSTASTVPTASNTSNEEIYKDGEISEFIHTKTGEVLKVLKVATTLTKDTFKSFRTYMKQEQGAYYSRYAKGFVIPNIQGGK